MTLYEFKALSDKEQAETTWKGEFLTSKVEGNRKFLLYQVDAFYVEVLYNPEENVIESLTSFANTGRLEKYFDQIDISQVI